MLLLAHPLGNANVRHAALAFAEAGLLAEFRTCLHWNPDAPAARLLPARVAGQLARRAFPEAARARTKGAATWRELGRHLAGRLPFAGWRGRLLRHETGLLSVDAVFRAFDRRVARRVRHWPKGGPALDAVYAYEDGAAETFRAAGERGLKRFYDLPIGYWRAGHAIFAEEAEREPAWAPTLTGRADSVEKLARKDAELAGADAVFVASTFTRSTLQPAVAAGLLAPGVPVHVVPYGAPEPAVEAESALAPRPAGTGKKLRVLFAGSLGQRKGLSYLLQAVEILGPARVELTLLGAKPVEDCEPLDRAARAHRWIPSLPHPGVLAEMSRQDVLVFPSLFEGFGLVIPEALSRGLPVIATAHTGWPDLLSADGAEGWLVPVRSAGAIAEKLTLLAADPKRLAAMKRAALARAAGLRWEDYRRRLATLVAGEKPESES